VILKKPARTAVGPGASEHRIKLFQRGRPDDRADFENPANVRRQHEIFERVGDNLVFEAFARALEDKAAALQPRLNLAVLSDLVGRQPAG
jgi:hypothetical protein